MKAQLLNFAIGGAGAIILSAAARALPAPLPGGSRFYLWFHQFTQLLLANFDKTKGNS